MELKSDIHKVAGEWRSPLNPEELWATCLKQIRERIRCTDFEQIFAHTRVAVYNKNDLTISVPDKWYYDQIEKNHMPILAPVLKQVFGDEVRLFYRLEN